MTDFATNQLIKWVNSKQYDQLINVTVVDDKSNIYYIAGVMNDILHSYPSLILIPLEANNPRTCFTITPRLRESPFEEIQRTFFLDDVNYVNETLFKKNNLKQYTSILIDDITSPIGPFTIYIHNPLIAISNQIKSELI